MKLCPQCETGYADSHVTCPTHGVMLGEIRDLRPGMLIRNTYRIVRKLGQGGMGAVYLAEHTLMGERQALKFLSPDLSKDEAFTSRFLREVRTLRQVRHRNVVDAGNLEPAEDGTLFFSMEFVDGPDLRDFLNASSGPLEVELALAIARSVAEGLGAAHALGMVHRDIKPENILLARSGDGYIPKIADFGIVATKENSSLYTRTGGTLLTMAYAAPEQWRGVRAADLDGRTDLYALGGVLYEILTGRTPFEAESYEGWAEQHKNSPPSPPSSLRPELAKWEGLDEFVLRLLAKDRGHRTQDVAETIHQLNAIKVSTWISQPVSDEEDEDSEKAHRLPMWVWFLGSFVLLALVFSAWRILSPSSRPSQGTNPTIQQHADLPTDKQTPNAAPVSSARRATLEAKSAPNSNSISPHQAPAAVPIQIEGGPTTDSGATWTDSATGLMWTKTDNGRDLSWQQAADYCRSLQLAGHTGWRLATIDELQGIYDFGLNTPGERSNGRVACQRRPAPVRLGVEQFSNARCSEVQAG
jgi:serine/threonine protein kinase